MPIYEYQCEFGHFLEEKQSIRDYHPNQVKCCPECGNEMERIISGGIGGFVDNVTTVGQLGERNWEKLGKNRQQEFRAKEKEKKEAGLREMGVDPARILEYKQARKLASLTKDQKRRYIQTGKLPP